MDSGFQIQTNNIDPDMSASSGVERWRIRTRTGTDFTRQFFGSKSL